MNILHLSTETYWRGGEQQIIYCVMGCLQQGHQAWVGAKADSEVAKYCQKHQIPLQTFPFTSAYDVKSVWQLLQFCKKKAIDIVHLHTSKGHTLGVLASLLGLPCRLVLSRRVDVPIKNNFFSHYKYNYKKISKIICVSQAIKKRLALKIQNTDKLTVIYDGIDVEKFAIPPSKKLHQEYQLANDTVIVGTISALTVEKDLPTFIQTAAFLTQHTAYNFHFFIVGEGPEKENLRALIVEKNLENQITLTGFRSDIPRVLSCLTIFLFTSQCEGLGTSVLDAMASHLPVVSTAVGGIPELITHKKNGLLYARGDAEGLAFGVRFLLDNPKKKEEIQKNALTTARKFSKEIMIKKTISVYENV